MKRWTRPAAIVGLTLLVLTGCQQIIGLFLDPDLAVESVVLDTDPDGLVAGVTLTISNSGGVAEGVEYAIYLSEDSTLNPATDYRVFSGFLDIEWRKEEVVNVSVEDDILPYLDGSDVSPPTGVDYFFGVFVDPSDAVAESTETNNDAVSSEPGRFGSALSADGILLDVDFTHTPALDASNPLKVILYDTAASGWSARGIYVLTSTGQHLLSTAELPFNDPGTDDFLMEFIHDVGNDWNPGAAPGTGDTRATYNELADGNVDFSLTSRTPVTTGVSYAVAFGTPPSSGSLDTGFGVNGKVLAAVNGDRDALSGLALQADGRIVGVGDTGLNDLFGAVRLLQDGTIDTSFAADGSTTIDFGTPVQNAHAVEIQADGRIVAIGEVETSPVQSYNFGVARLNVDGTMDTGFGGDGTVESNFELQDSPFDVAVQPDGRILVGGGIAIAGAEDFGLARYTTAGALDTTFDSDGWVRTAIGSGNESIREIALQAGGEIVATGVSHNGSNLDVAVVRYLPDGSLDTSFDGDGMVTVPVGLADDHAESVVIQADGKIVIGGFYDSGSMGFDWFLMRLNANGSLDSSFGTGGIVTTAPSSSDDRIYQIQLDVDENIVAAGFLTQSSILFAAARFDTDGNLDTGFGSSGIATADLGSGDDRGLALAIQADGKILVGGYSYVAVNDYRFGFARFNP